MDSRHLSSVAGSRTMFSVAEVNPFSHTIELSWLRLAQVIVMTVTLAPFRLAAIAACLLLGYVQAVIALFGVEDAELNKAPLIGWRRRMVQAAAFSLRAAFFCGGFHRVQTRGTRALPNEAPVLCVAPHISYFDIVIACVTGIPVGVSRTENLHEPIIGRFIRAIQPVTVSRDDRSSRGAVIAEMKERVAARCWPQLLIFPEGTTTNGKCLIAFKPGAFILGVPVQPVLMKYKNSWNTYAWTWEGSGGLPILWYTLCQWQTDLEVQFLPVYYPSDAEKSDPQLFADNVRQTMADALGVHTTGHSYEDCRLMKHAASLDLPASVALVEFQKLQKKLKLNLDHLKDLLVKFREVSSSSLHGRLGIDEFATYLDLPVSDTLRRLFALYDRDGKGYVTFKDYVLGMFLLAMPANGEDTIKLAFEVFDNGKKGYIIAEELSDLLFDTIGVPHRNSAVLFEKVDEDQDGRITFDEFRSYAEKKPEYALLFQTYRHHQKAAKQANGSCAAATDDSTATVATTAFDETADAGGVDKVKLD